MKRGNITGDSLSHKRPKLTRGEREMVERLTEAAKRAWGPLLVASARLTVPHEHEYLSEPVKPKPRKGKR